MATSRSTNYTSEEMEILITFLENNRALVSGELGRSVKNLKEQNDLWQKATDLINGIGLGKERTSKQVRKKWSDLKNIIKKKVANNRHSLTGTGGGESTYEDLSGLESRVLALIGKRCSEGITGIPFDLASHNFVSIVV